LRPLTSVVSPWGAQQKKRDRMRHRSYNGACIFKDYKDKDSQSGENMIPFICQEHADVLAYIDEWNDLPYALWYGLKCIKSSDLIKEA
jgi:hypothetical protein